MADIATAFYVSDGVVYEIRVKIRDFEEAVVVKSSDVSVISQGTVLRKLQWNVIIDSAKFLAIKQKDDEMKLLQRELADLEHSAKVPGRVSKDDLQEKRGSLLSLTTYVEQIKYKGPTIVRLRGVL